MPEQVRDISMKLESLYCLYFVTRLTTLMVVWTVEFSSWPILVKASVLSCWLSWPLVTQPGGRELTCCMMVGIRNWRLESGYCILQQTYENA